MHTRRLALSAFLRRSTHNLLLHLLQQPLLVVCCQRAYECLEAMTLKGKSSVCLFISQASPPLFHPLPRSHTSRSRRRKEKERRATLRLTSITGSRFTLIPILWSVIRDCGQLYVRILSLLYCRGGQRRVLVSSIISATPSPASSLPRPPPQVTGKVM